MIRKIYDIPMKDVDFELDSTMIAAYLAQSYSRYESISRKHIQRIIYEKNIEHIDIDNIDVASVELQYHDMCRLFHEIEDIYSWTQRRDVEILEEKIQRMLSNFNKFPELGIVGAIAQAAGVFERPVARCSHIYTEYVQYIVGHTVVATDIHGNVLYCNDDLKFFILSKEEIESQSEWKRFKQTHDSFEKRRV